MAHTRIKICGITRPGDAQAAVASGADAIGLVFYRKSPRAVDAEQAARIAAVVPPFVSIVALFVDELAAEVERILSAVPIDLLQFHGDEEATYCRQFNKPWVKAMRMRAGFDPAAACDRYPGARGILLDTYREGVPGGTGHTFDWQLAAGRFALPLILAGGLTAENVGAAIACVQPYAVDVSGGVESAPGIKDATAIDNFTAAVRAADQH